MASRIRFDFTLIDTRHQPFVEGRCDTLLSLFQVIGNEKLSHLAGLILLGLMLLFWGGGSLIYDYSVEWVTTEATITDIIPVQREDKFNWWYLYAFQTQNGDKATGRIVLEDRDSFTAGQNIPVRYVRSDPEDNLHADDPMPRGVRDWFFLSMGAFLLGSATFILRPHIDIYQALRGIGRAGQAVAGKIVKVDRLTPHELKVNVAFIFTTPNGSRMQNRQLVSLSHLHLPGNVVPGAVVAVWCVGDDVALLV